MYNDPTNDEIKEMGRKTARRKARVNQIVWGIFFIALGIAFIISGSVIIADGDSIGAMLLVFGIVFIIVYPIIFYVSQKRYKNTLNDESKLLEEGRSKYEPTRSKTANEYYAKMSSTERATGLSYYINQFNLRTQGLSPTDYANAGYYNGMIADVIFDELNKKFVICTPQNIPVFDAANVFDYRKIIACSMSDNGYSIKKKVGMDSGTGFLIGGVMGAVIAGTSQKEVTEKIEDYVLEVVCHDKYNSSLIFDFGPNRGLAEILYNYFINITRLNNLAIHDDSMEDITPDDIGDVSI